MGIINRRGYLLEVLDRDLPMRVAEGLAAHWNAYNVTDGDDDPERSACILSPGFVEPKPQAN